MKNTFSKIGMSFSLLFASAASAALIEERVEFSYKNKVFEGYVVYDDKVSGAAPAVLVIHDWMGLGAYSERRARELAGLGYVAMAADVYGKGVRPKDAAEAAQFSGALKSDRAVLRGRTQAALKFLHQHKKVNSRKVAAIGYCFGGATVLELARAGEKLSGVVSFHGGLAADSKLKNSSIKSKVLVLHGADDPFVPDTEVAAFQSEMRKSKVDWQMVSYGNSVHSFTHPEAGSDPSKGAAYNEAADKRSWIDMKNFLEEAFN